MKPFMDKSDEELMREYQEGNKEMLEKIFIRYQKRIFNCVPGMFISWRVKVPYQPDGGEG